MPQGQPKRPPLAQSWRSSPVRVAACARLAAALGQMSFPLLGHAKPLWALPPASTHLTRSTFAPVWVHWCCGTGGSAGGDNAATGGVVCDICLCGAVVKGKPDGWV